MATYVKGDSVANAKAYKLYEKKSNAENLIDIANPVSANAAWSFDEATMAWTATNSNSANLRFDADLAAGDTVVFSADYVVNSGSFIMTIRSAANSILVSTVVNKTGTFTAEYTATEAGAYRFQTAGNQEKNSAVCSNVSVKIKGDEGDAEDTYILLDTASDINFDVSEIVADGGKHTFVVQAKGDGVNYTDSDYSNEVTYPTN